MSAILSLKQFFKAKPKPLSYKHRHFLNALDSQKLKEILLYSEGDNLAQTALEAKNKKVLFCNDGYHKYALKKLLQIEPSFVMNLAYGKKEWVKQRLGYTTLQGDLNHLPVRRGYFDYYFCPFVLANDTRKLEKWIQKFSEHMINGQKLFLSLQHPGLNQILYNQNPATNVVSDVSLSKFFDVLKRNSLFTENIHEGSVDLSLKPYFTNNDFDYYHEYKGTPLSVVFSTVKFQRKSSL